MRKLVLGMRKKPLNRLGALELYSAIFLHNITTV